MPTITVETGWSQTYPFLRPDVDVWLRGGAGMTNICILLNLNKRGGNRFAGILELLRRPYSDASRTAAGFSPSRCVALRFACGSFTGQGPVDRQPSISMNSPSAFYLS
jgi:hypothetical protein